MTLEQQIKDLNPWYQAIDLGNGVLTTNTTTGTAEQVYKDIRSFLPEHIHTMSFLDIGCNSGYFTVRLMLDGAALGIGIDINPLCIKQAEFVSSTLLKGKYDIKFLLKNFKDYLVEIASNERYEAIIASSVLYPRVNLKVMDEKYLEDYFYQRAKLLSDKTFTIIARWRNENNCRNGDIFYDQLQKFDYYETGRKELCNRTLVRYQKGGNLKLAKNHNMVFDDNRPRGWDEIISEITGCKNMRAWFYLDKEKRKDLSDFITYVSPKKLIYRNFMSKKHKSLYNTTTEYDFLSNHKSKLFKSIKEIGIQTPPVVREINKGYIVDDGNHRSGIANVLKLDKIGVIILKEC